MSKSPKQQPETAKKPKRKLTAGEKREIRRIMDNARGDGKPHSAQDTLPFRQMYPDGLCKLDDTTWSRCIEFEDVNYQLAQPDDQTSIFEALCDLYNSHDSTIGMELSLPCRRMNREDFVKRIEIAAQGDRFDPLRELYTQILRRQLERGNNGFVKTKLLVLTIEAKDIRTARTRFSRIILDALNQFKVIGALAKALDGHEWLALLHGIMHPDGDRFSFDWDWLAPSGLHVKDFIAPSSFRFGEARRFQMGGKFCAASFLQINAPEMDDRILAELLETDSNMLVSLHIRSMDQNDAIKTVKRKITDIDSMKIDAQKRAVREGFDMDIIPTDIATYAGEAKNILRDLQSRNSFCKKVLVHEANNGHRDINRRASIEISMSDLPEEAMEQLAVYDDYPWEHTSFPICDNVILIKNDRLAEALEAMPEQERDIILMYWFLDMADRDIAETMNMARRTVNRHRQKAYQLLRKLMGGEAVD